MVGLTSNSSNSSHNSSFHDALKLTDFGELQHRYQTLSLRDRAKAVLADAEPALNCAERILEDMAPPARTHGVFDAVRKNPAVVGRMRPSEAKNMLLDSAGDFIGTTRQKLQAWRKTMERLAGGEGVVKDGKREYVPQHMPVAAALASSCTASSYLSMIQLALGELAKRDGEHGAKYLIDLAKIRRCATLLSDCENASSISALVH